MPYYRKLTGPRIYLSPFNPSDEETYTKWAKWMNNHTIADTYGGHNNQTNLSSAKKTVAELSGHRFDIVLPGVGANGFSKTGNILSICIWIYWHGSIYHDFRRRTNHRQRSHRQP